MKWSTAGKLLTTIGLVVIGAVANFAMSAPAHAKRVPNLAARKTTSFHFHNIPVRSALQLIAEEGRFNLVVSDSVEGTISLRLEDVTWEQALDIVLRMKGLSQRVDHGTRSVTAGP